jgi:hypothetical protein
MHLPHPWKYCFGKTALLTGALTVFAAFSPPASRADHNANCQMRIAKADHRLHEAIEHHGYRSEQAEHARHDLAEAREHCYTSYHEWWDEDSRTWHTDRDWKDEDHEHYRDRDRDRDDHPRDRDEHPR